MGLDERVEHLQVPSGRPGKLDVIRVALGITISERLRCEFVGGKTHLPGCVPIISPELPLGGTTVSQLPEEIGLHGHSEQSRFNICQQSESDPVCALLAGKVRIVAVRHGGDHAKAVAIAAFGMMEYCQGHQCYDIPVSPSVTPPFLHMMLSWGGTPESLTITPVAIAGSH